LKIWAHFNISSSSEQCSLPIFNYSARNVPSSFSLYVITCVVFCSRGILSYSMLPNSNILYKNPFIFMYFIIGFPVYSRQVYHELLNPIRHYWSYWILVVIWVEQI
jgi:hypothetical protein